MNVNCLEGFECPECGSIGPFQVEAETTVTVYDSGTDEAGSFQWMGGSGCRCLHCGQQGAVDDFTNKAGVQKKDRLIEVVARAICRACEDNPDHRGDARGNDWRWQDYRETAIEALDAAVLCGGLRSGEVHWPRRSGAG